MARSRFAPTISQRMVAGGLLTPPEACALLRCSRWTLYKLVIKGEILRIGELRWTRYFRRSIEDYMARSGR